VSDKTEWRNRIVGEGEQPASQFVANPANWRVHPQAQRDAMRGALNEVGWVQRVIVNRRTGYLLDGHERVWQALQNGDAPVPYVEVDLDEAEEAYVLATLDPIGAMAQADKEQLDALLREVQSGEAGVQAMLSELAEKAGLYPEAPKEAPEPQVDRAEELRGKWQTERGQVWEIPSATVPGKCHRLMCGDSTSAEDVERLLDGAKPLLMVTDPPYGVEYDPAWRARAGINKNDGKMGVVANDGRIDWREAWALFRGDVAYVWHAGRHASAVQDSLASEGLVVVAQVIWNKDRFALSRGDYHWKHEPCWYAVRAGASHHWAGARDQSTVWDVPRADDSGHGHGTQKPVECMARPIRNHEGDVYDPFLGSGTTMVAAEQLGRPCYGMEIEPKYVAVALERLADMGLEPRLVE
jgi:DNA modification methylase